MGAFSVKMRVWNPAQPRGVEEFDAFVDTGAAFSWVSRSRLERLGVRSDRKMGFRAIEGRVPDREIEGLGLAADPVQKRLVPTVMLALGVGDRGFDRKSE